MGENQTRTQRRVLHVTTVPETLLGFFPGLIQHQREMGYSVTAASSCQSPSLIKKAERRLVTTIHPVPLTRSITPIQDARALLRLIALLRRESFDIVHVHTPKAGLLGGLAGWLTGCPLRVYTMRGAPHVTSQGIRRMLLVLSETVACSCAHRVICVSHSLHEEMSRLGVCSADKMQVIGAGSSQGVDAEVRFNPERLTDEYPSPRLELGIPSDAVVLGFVGRLARDKGIADLIEVWRNLHGSLRSVHLIVVGALLEPRDGASKTEIETLEKMPRTHLTGAVDNIEWYYGAFDLLLTTSHREGFPNVVLEASSMRCPTVAFDVVGCRDAVVDGETGFLAELGDLGGFERKVRHLIGDPELRTRMGQAARERCLRWFQPRQIFEGVDQMYRQPHSKPV